MRSHTVQRSRPEEGEGKLAGASSKRARALAYLLPLGLLVVLGVVAGFSLSYAANGFIKSKMTHDAVHVTLVGSVLQELFDSIFSITGSVTSLCSYVPGASDKSMFQAVVGNTVSHFRAPGLQINVLFTHANGTVVASYLETNLSMASLHDHPALSAQAALGVNTSRSLATFSSTINGLPTFLTLLQRVPRNPSLPLAGYVLTVVPSLPANIWSDLDHAEQSYQLEADAQTAVCNLCENLAASPLVARGNFGDVCLWRLRTSPSEGWRTDSFRVGLLGFCMALYGVVTAVLIHRLMLHSNASGKHSHPSDDVAVPLSRLCLAQKEMSTSPRDVERICGSFVQNMSHEIRTPLNGIFGSLELLSALDVDDRVQEGLQVISACSNTLLGIVNDALDFATIRAGKLSLAPQKLSLYDLFDNLALILSPSAYDSSVEYVFDIPTDLPPFVYADLVHLKQCLLNVLGNAFKFTHEGSVRTTVSFTDCAASCGGDPPSGGAGAGTLTVVVQDTGIGIDPRFVKRLFQPFTQADVGTTRKYGGNGLGLFITKSVIEGMGGNIDLVSTPAAGTTVVMTVPLVVASSRDPVQYSTSSHERKRNMDSLVTDRRSDMPPMDLISTTRTSVQPHVQEVFVVGDDAHVQNLLVNLRSVLPGAPITTFADAKEVLDSLHRRPDGTHPLVLMDAACLPSCPDDRSQLLASFPIPFLLSGMHVKLRIGHAQAQHVHLRKPCTPTLLCDGLVRLHALCGKPMEEEEPDVDLMLPALTTSHISMSDLRSVIAQPVADAPTQPPASTHQHRVLVVDDLSMNRRILSRVLQTTASNLGLQLVLVHAADGQEALELVQTQSFSIVFSDLHMPRMDGYEFAQQTRLYEEKAGVESVTIIAVTADVSDSSRQKALAAGMQDHISKPLSQSDIQSALLRLLPRG